jgi:hypothetical protein
MKAAGKIYVQHPSGPQTKVKIPADAKKSVKGVDQAPPSKGIPGNVPVPDKMDRLKGKRDFYEEGDDSDFAKLAPPTDKITFADKIAGAKKEVDEMLGDVAADAMKKAIGGHAGEEEVEEGYAEMDAWLKSREKEKGTGKFDTRKTSTGTVYTRKPETFAGDDEKVDPAGEKRGRGRPKSGAGPRQERVTAKSRKTDRTSHGQTGFKKAVKEEGSNDDCNAAIALLKKNGYKVSKAEEELDEKAVSKKQQKFMGMVHAAQKGEKPASKEVGKVAKTMKKKDAEDFASTKHKGLPEKVKAKKEGLEKHSDSELKAAASKDRDADEKSGVSPRFKTSQVKDELKKRSKEEVEETTTAGSVTTAPAKTAKGGGFGFGKGIYDSFNRDVEAMISESINVSMNSSTEGGNSLTITATDEDATKLAALLKMAGLGNGEESSDSCGCGSTPCSCNAEQEVDENAPDYPTNEVEAEDNFEYSGGLNGPKSTGQTTVPVIASQEERQYADEEEDAIKRMMEMAGIKEAKKPDFPDVDDDSNKKETLEKALQDKKDKEEKKVEESIFALTNSWKEYKG